MLDLAIDFNTGDLLVAPNGDIETREGQDTVEQRIRVRLKIVQGEWLLDPTNGQLGSTLTDAMRMSVPQALNLIPLVVKEALEPMTDIIVSDVTTRINALDPSSIDFQISYSMVDDPDGEQLSTDISATDLAGVS